MGTDRGGLVCTGPGAGTITPAAAWAALTGWTGAAQGESGGTTAPVGGAGSMGIVPDVANNCLWVQKGSYFFDLNLYFTTAGTTALVLQTAIGKGTSVVAATGGPQLDTLGEIQVTATAGRVQTGQSGILVIGDNDVGVAPSVAQNPPPWTGSPYTIPRPQCAKIQVLARDQAASGVSFTFEYGTLVLRRMD